MKARDLTPLYVLAGLRFAFSLATHQGYGIFRDELYYLACAEHLDWGYVDHPPMIAYTTWLARALGGDSLLSLRFLPGLFGGLTVFVAGLTARAMGGGRWAMILAAGSTAVAPILLAFAHFNSMNVLEPLFWGLGAHLVVRIARGDSPRLWLWFGVVCGLGLMTKHSMLFFGFGVAVALLVDPQLRPQLRTPAPYLALVIALVLFAPNLAWQVRHGFPTLEFMENARAHKNVALPAWKFLFEQVMQQGPFALPVWGAGLIFSLRLRGLRARPVGIIYLSLLAIMLATHAKTYYLAAAYPMLFAAGGVAFEQWGKLAPRLSLGFAVLGGLIGLPMTVPVLPVPQFVAYAQALGFKPSSGEKKQLGQLPQLFADMHGWQQLAEDVARAFHTLSPAQRARCGIYGNNYGEAGAIDFFGPALGLPKASSGHNSYFLWGLHPASPTCMLLIGGDPEDHLKSFREVRAVGESRDTLRMPYENVTLYLGTDPRRPVEQSFAASKHFE